MKIVKLANHSVDLDLLSDIPTVLDVGCRGFDFTREILAIRPGARVIGMDPDVAILSSYFRAKQNPEMDSFKLMSFALVGDQRKTARYASYSTGEGNFLTDLATYYNATFTEVPCMTISDLTYGRWWLAKYWDLVKLDCEGSEFGILENWPGPIAQQISVEFHDSGYTPGYGPDYDYTPMFSRLAGFGYHVRQHERSKQGDGTGHWDSLITL